MRKEIRMQTNRRSVVDGLLDCRERDTFINCAEIFGRHSRILRMFLMYVSTLQAPTTNGN